MSQLYTLNDVRQRNGENGADTWIVIRDIVYDVTKYLDEVCVYFGLKFIKIQTSSAHRNNKILKQTNNNNCVVTEQ